MTPKQIAHLRQCCHDEQIAIKAQMRCGKMIPSLNTIVQMYGIIEEILRHVERQSTGLAEDA